MADGETEGADDDDEAAALVAELAPCRATIARLIADILSIREKHPVVHDLLFDVAGGLEEVDSLLEDAPNNLDTPNRFPPHVG